ncbi:pyroglutamylated RFamide peptide receptor-like [Limulus polyphemus]|uniref:Pyroglutamylated RFamide peptide receptor-like n=1 Tax=Limulus polyphemus TaxID=6850 RepID=A0ABM1B4Q0_LIMPO|nr:pyroglutamylated RFamide peptide receptor-like [Limulus polyphemus]
MLREAILSTLPWERRQLNEEDGFFKFMVTASLALLNVSDMEHCGKFLNLFNDSFPDEFLEAMFEFLVFTGKQTQGSKCADPKWAVLPLPVTWKVLFVMILSILFVTSLLGNGTSAFVAWSFRKTKTVSCFFIMSLAISDILQTVMVLPAEVGNIVADMQWVYGPSACKTIPIIQNTSSMANGLTLCCIAIGRYVAITKALHWKSFERKNLSAFIVVIIWVTSLALSIPVAFIFAYHIPKKQNSQTFDLNRSPIQMKALAETGLSLSSDDLPGYCTQTEEYLDADSIKYYAFIFPAIMFLPLFFIIMFLYTYLSYFLWVRKPVGDLQSMSTQQYGIQQLKKKRVVKILISLIVLFFLCRAPTSLYNLWLGTIVQEPKVSDLVVRYTFVVMKLLNCTLNPIFYSLLHDRLKTHLKMVCEQIVYLFTCAPCKKCWEVKRNDNESSTTDTVLTSFTCRRNPLATKQF